MSNKDRDKHVGKNKVDKRNYFQLLKKPDKYIDDTEEGNGDIDNTNTSLSDTTDSIKKSEVANKTGKSLRFIIRDYFAENLATSIIASLFVGLLFAYISSNREIGEMKTQLNSLEKDTTYIIEKYQPENNDKINNLDQNVEILKMEFRKDIEYLKDQLERIESKK